VPPLLSADGLLLVAAPARGIGLGLDRDPDRDLTQPTDQRTFDPERARLAGQDQEGRLKGILAGVVEQRQLGGRSM
jgi:hypothetical protein